MMTSPRRPRPRRGTRRPGLGWYATFLLSAVLEVVLASSLSTPAFGRERIAVLILPVNEGDRALADNLTEVAISKLAEISEFDLVGTRDLRRRLTQTGSGELPIDCLHEVACLARIGIAVGVRRLVSGSVRPDGTRYLVALAINDIELGTVARTFFRAVEGGLDSLITSVQDGVTDLFQLKVAPGRLLVESVPEGATVLVDEQHRGTTPLRLDPVDPGPHRLRVELHGRFPWKKEVQIAPGQNLLVSIKPEDLRSRRTWAPYLAYGTAAAAVLTFAAAGLFGALARVHPMGRSRAEAQVDLELRADYATITNVLLAGGIALSGVSAFTFIRLRRDIAGE
jgi:hypothetical protein